MLDEEKISCPYCGERITILLDPTESEQSYTEDCQVCCRPITVLLQPDGAGGFDVIAQDENSV